MKADQPDLVPVSPETIELLKSESKKLVDDCLAAAGQGLKNETDTFSDIGTLRTGLMMMLKMLIPIMALGDRELLEDQTRWASVRLPEDGISTGQLYSNISLFLTVMEKTLPDSAVKELSPYLVLLGSAFRDD